MFILEHVAAIGMVVAGALFAGILVSLRIGRWLGRRAIARYGDEAVPGIGSLETAVFALLGLLIAFTFSGALERFDARRSQVVAETNAIGTAWLRIDLVPIDLSQGQIAQEAAVRFGRGRHPAALNYGDCFSYALAAATGDVLLCTGDDFPATDLEIVRVS